MLHIYIDADACPVKKEVYRVASRYQLRVTLVANSWMRTPVNDRVDFVLVGDALDAADDWITEAVEAGDIVITADIPLASRCLERDAEVIGNSGRAFTKENIGQILATRDLMTELRGTGEQTGGPPPMKNQDRSRFLQGLDELIQRLRRQHSAGGDT